MINQDRWINYLPNVNTEFSKTTNQLDHDKWINTISKKDTYNSVKKYNPVKKYNSVKKFS